MSDASAAVSALLREGPARARFAADLIHAPHLIDFEVAGAIRHSVLAGRRRPADGANALGRWSRTALERYPARGLLSRIWELHANLTTYDAAYVALAEALDCPLVTADHRLAGAPGLQCEIQLVPR